MTCVVGVQHGNQVFMGADSAAVETSSLISFESSLKKVFHVREYLIGYTSSFRMGQILQYHLEVPAISEGMSELEHMVVNFAATVRSTLLEHHYKNVDTDNLFLTAYKGILYVIYSDFQVQPATHGFCTVGCGSELALGSLYSTQNRHPNYRIKVALEAATQFSAGVRPPFIIEKQKRGR